MTERVDPMKASERVGGRRVDFIGIGFQRCATSWLFRCITQHQRVRGPVAGADKEVNFFNHHYTRGFHWYHSQFEFGSWKTGEFSVLYAPEARVASRIYEYNPDTRLIVSLRDPTARAFSHHLHEVRRGRVPSELNDFDEALQRNPSYVDQGRYFTHLLPFFELFGRDRIHVVVFDDVATKGSEVIAATYSFLGEDPTFEPELTGRVINAARPVRNEWLERALRSGTAAVRHAVGDRTYLKVKHSAAGRGFVDRTRREFKPDEVPPMSERTRAELRRGFRSEVSALSDLIGRDLSHWSQ